MKTFSDGLVDDGAGMAACAFVRRLSCSLVMRRLVGGMALGCVLAVSTAARADFDVPAGGTFSLGGGGLDLGCGDLTVGGTLHLATGPLTGVRNVTIQGGGTIEGDTGSITLGGNWTNTGTFTAGASQVSFTDACGGNESIVTGNTTFHGLSLNSTAGKTFRFAAGSMQTVTTTLTILGTLANPLQIRSTVSGQTAFMSLLGSQNIAHVGVNDNTAIGAWLAPFQSNEGGSGPAVRWFGNPFAVTQIPTLSPLAMLMLILLLGAIAAGSWSRWQRDRNSFWE